MRDPTAPPWDHLWTDAHLATLAGGEGEGYGEVRDGALGVADGRIAWVGPASALPGPPREVAREVRSAGGGWITPGLIDCHTHLVFGGNRADEFERRLKGATYAQIARQGGGILSTVRATREAPEDALVDAARPRLRELMRDGVTTVEIKSGYGLDTATELRMLRAARRLGREEPVEVVTSFLGAHAVPPEHAGDRSGYVDLVADEMIPRVAAEGLADAVDAFLEDIAFGPGDVDRVFDAARGFGLPLRLHADQLEDGGGAALAARHGALSADHLEHTSEDGVRAMAEAGTVAVLLPGAWYTLRESTLPPLEALEREGVPVALATDLNPGSSPLMSVRMAMNLACTLFRMTPARALRGVTRNAAQALGLTDRGRLEAGLRADLAVWNVETPAELAYWIGGPPPVAVMVGGVAR